MNNIPSISEETREMKKTKNRIDQTAAARRCGVPTDKSIPHTVANGTPPPPPPPGLYMLANCVQLIAVACWSSLKNGGEWLFFYFIFLFGLASIRKRERERESLNINETFNCSLLCRSSSTASTSSKCSKSHSSAVEHRTRGAKAELIINWGNIICHPYNFLGVSIKTNVPRFVSLTDIWPRQPTSII
jgi:hypothetical protein